MAQLVATATALLTASFVKRALIDGQMAQIVLLGANVGTALTALVVSTGIEVTGENTALITALKEAIGPRLAQDALAATANGELVDLMTPLPDGANITLITKKNPADAAPLFRHSLGHVMSMAVGEFYKAKGYGERAAICAVRKDVST